MKRTRIHLALLLLSFAGRAAAQDAPASDAPPPPAAEAATATATATEASTPAEEGPGAVQLMSAEELNALGIDAESAVDKSIRLSGFADFGFGATLNDNSSYWRGSGIVPSSPTFYVGNLNIYLDKQLTDDIRTMVEVRLTFLPNGSRGFGFEERTDTSTSDYVDLGRVTRWGALILERVYVEWSPFTLLTIRGGLFLTPYGIWNVDHGTPVYIPVRQPRSLSDSFFPEKQTGLELYGRAVLSPTLTMGYHLTFSNGDGPISEYSDLDANKAIGGRIYWELHALGWWRLGGSAYYGRYTDSAFEAQFDGGSVSAEERIVSQYDALSWALDLTWDLGDFHLQGEMLFNERAYTERGRVLRETEVGTILPADRDTIGGYGLVGYRLPWLGIMPFVLAEYVTGGIQDLDVSATILQVGLNIRPVDALVLKTSYERMVIDEDLIEPLNTIWFQVAWAF